MSSTGMLWDASAINGYAIEASRPTKQSRSEPMFAKKLYGRRLRTLVARFLGKGHAQPTVKRENPSASTLLRWK